VSAKRRIAVLGATGSIGSSALDVIARHPERFQVTTLSAHRGVDALLALSQKFKPQRAVIADCALLDTLAAGLRTAGLTTEPLAGPDALIAAATASDTDTVIAAIVGAAGMASTLAAAQAGKRLLLANKESVVLAGALLMDAAARSGAQIIPIDSEHNAIFQCLPVAGDRLKGVRRLVLTASGGPFRGKQRVDLETITPEQACAHPNWVMGRKISVDSATLMNKGLEVIEAHWLFGLPPERIEVLVHPQSIVHSLVDYADGSMLAQLGLPDMRTALAQALAWPERVESGVGALDLARLGHLDFEPPDRLTFPCLDLAYHALQLGGTAGAIVNAANEVAVSAFLQGQLCFLGIAELIARTLDKVPVTAANNIDALLAADHASRAAATHHLNILESN
jgi:1-deoxy-D-xylulose-5-phosphate reductoisomerase